MGKIKQLPITPSRLAAITKRADEMPVKPMSRKEIIRAYWGKKNANGN